jgi:peptidoglycan/LPS O-acetylase OafA/YrhL
MLQLKFEPATAARLDGLQVLRAVAALMVVFSHVLRIEHEEWASNSSTYLPALPFGDFAVYTFFVISGFIMYSTAGRDFGVPGAAWRFICKRLSRIAPIYWLFTGLALICPFVFEWRPPTAGGLVLSLAFLPDITQPSYHPVLAVGWSLSFEMLFYLVFAACLMLPRRIGPRVLTVAFPLFMVATVVSGESSLVLQPWWPFVHYWGRPISLLFVCGVVLAMVREQFGQVTDKGGIGIWLALSLLVLVPTSMLAWNIGSHAKAEMAIAIVVVLLCVMSSGRGWSILEPLVRLGDASYALYLSHSFVIGGLSVVWIAALGPIAPILFTAVALGASCGTAWLVHVGVEKPLVRLSQRVLGRSDQLPRDGQRAVA